MFRRVCKILIIVNGRITYIFFIRYAESFQLKTREFHMETRSVPISRIGECKSNTCDAARPNGIFLHGYDTLDYIAKHACIITPCIVRRCDSLLRDTLYIDKITTTIRCLANNKFNLSCDACRDVSRYYLYRLDFRFNPDGTTNRAVRHSTYKYNAYMM